MSLRITMREPLMVRRLKLVYLVAFVLLAAIPVGTYRMLRDELRGVIFAWRRQAGE